MAQMEKKQTYFEAVQYLNAGLTKEARIILLSSLCQIAEDVFFSLQATDYIYLH